MTKQLITANWREGADAICADMTNEETSRYTRVCTRLMAECFKSDEAPIHDMEALFKRFLAEQGYSQGYIYNLMIPFKKIVKRSPTKEFFHEKANKWRDLLCRHNKYPCDKTSEQAVELFLSYVVAVGLSTKPLTTTETQAFKAYLVERGYNPHEQAAVLARKLRGVLRKNNLYIDEAKMPVEIPTQLIPILKKMELAAVNADSSKPTRRTLREIRESSNERPIQSNTWKKVRRDFIRYVRYQVDERGFKFKNWEGIFSQDELMDYLDHRNATDDGITAKTAETITASISKSMRLLNKVGVLVFSSQKLDETRQLIWKLSKNFNEVFDKKSTVIRKRDSGGLPLYENLYPTYVQYVKKEFERIKKQDSSGEKIFGCKKRLVLLICAVEFGWRPEDYAQTIKLNNVTAEKTILGEEFLFFSFTPSKTKWRSHAPVVKAPIPPWFKDIFDDYIRDLKKYNTTEFFPKNSMLSKTDKYGRTIGRFISRTSFLVFGQSLCVNDFRRIHSHFFERRGIPALYWFAGRSASAELSKITELELKTYAAGAASAEGLFNARYNEKIQTYLGVEWSGKKLLILERKKAAA